MVPALTLRVARIHHRLVRTDGVCEVLVQTVDDCPPGPAGGTLRRPSENPPRRSVVRSEAVSERMDDSERSRPLSEVLDEWTRRGFAYAWSVLRNREDALDAVQSALLAVWKHRGRLHAGPQRRAWFYRVLRNKCIDIIRRRQSRPTVQLDPDIPQAAGDGPSERASRAEQCRRLREALASLPADLREILILRDYHDLSYAEIARVLEIPAGTVMSRLHRARLALRERVLAQEGRDAGL